MAAVLRFSVRSFLAVLSFAFLLASAAAQPFTFEFADSDLTDLSYGSASWADADGDGKLDAFLTGAQRAFAPYEPTSRLFLSRSARAAFGGGIFQNFEPVGMPAGLWHSDAAWSDYDGDGDLDVLLLGATNESEPFAGFCELYRNDGSGGFSPVGAALRPIYSGSADWGDYDNDGDPDLLVTGMTAAGPLTRLYRNDDGLFAEVDAGLTGVAFGEVAWGDYDSDGDLDVLLTGVAEDVFLTQIYRNDGGAFVPLQLSLPALAFGSVAWGDYDADGDLDFALLGGVLDPKVMEGRFFIYRNNGGSSFTPAFTDDGYLAGDTFWGDYDVDGDLDVLAVGALYPDGPRFTRVYKNQANGTFVAVLHLVGAIFSDAAWGDYDDDGDLDVLLAGLAGSSQNISNLYRNTQTLINTPPGAPSGLQAQVQDGAATLSWQPATDAQTLASGLTYNLRVGTAPGASDVMPPLSDPATGRRRLAAHGNVFHNSSWRLNLAPGTYYWSVQAVDAAFKGGAFAEEGSFTVSSTGGTVTDVERPDGLGQSALAQNYPNPFAGQTQIRYALEAPGTARVAVYDVLGRQVKVLADGPAPAGERTLAWDGRSDTGERLSAGVYVLRLETDAGPARSRTMTLLQ